MEPTMETEMEKTTALGSLSCLVAGALLAAILGASGCSDTETLDLDYDFASGPLGWVAGFADYPAGEETFYRLEADYRALPAPLDTSRSALYIAGVNRSDDLWMYYRTEVALSPDTTYRVSFDVEIATDASSGCIGVGGAPGEGVTVKAGASLIEPDRALDGQGYWRMNVDKGDQAQGGEDAVVIGDLANSRACEDGPEWELKGLDSGASMTLTTDGTGRAWLFVGTDSGYESLSTVYYVRFRARFEPM